MENITDNPSLLTRVFRPFALKKLMDVIKNDQKFVHYTSAEVAISILQNEEIWMRKSTCMNDYSEVDYGLDLIMLAWNDDCGRRFKEQLDKLFPEISLKIAKKFDDWTQVFRFDTYLTCISEHDKETEDTLGRLSMWRAYGGDAGVALTLNNDVLVSETNALKAYSSPVAYLDKQQFFTRLNTITSNISENASMLKMQGERAIFDNVFHMLRSAVLHTKHPGFGEEREWRIVYSPSYARSNVITTQVKTINNIPQPICKIPLRDIPEQNLTNLHLSKFLRSIIIGPTEYPHAMQEAFISVLQEKGVQDAHLKVKVSNIPLR